MGDCKTRPREVAVINFFFEISRLLAISFVLRKEKATSQGPAGRSLERIRFGHTERRRIISLDRERKCPIGRQQGPPA